MAVISFDFHMWIVRLSFSSALTDEYGNHQINVIIS